MANPTYETYMQNIKNTYEHIDKISSQVIEINKRIQYVIQCIQYHGDKYDYNNINITNLNNDNIHIKCPIHGIFNIKAINHLLGEECNKCVVLKNKEKRKAKKIEEFKQKAKELYGDKYDYSLMKYIHARHEIQIICPIHGIFKQSPRNFIKRNGYCNECKIDTYKNNFIKKSRQIYKKFDLSKIKYINSKTPVEIICPKHGSFFYSPDDIIRSNRKIGCKKCRFSNE